MSQLKRFPYSGAIDADGHILEPPDMWEKYIEPKYRDRDDTRSVKTARDWKCWNSLAVRRNTCDPEQLAQFGAMGKGEEVMTPHPDRTYVGMAPFGSMDPKERLARMDRRRLEKGHYLSQPWAYSGKPKMLSDLELQAAFARAYNRWVEEFCADFEGRLLPIAHISIGDGHEAARELERAVKNGAKRRLHRSVYADE